MTTQLCSFFKKKEGNDFDQFYRTIVS